MRQGEAHAAGEELRDKRGPGDDGGSGGCGGGGDDGDATSSGNGHPARWIVPKEGYEK
jgi:hypothetical protein